MIPREVKDAWNYLFVHVLTHSCAYSPALLYNYGKAVGSNEMMDFALYNLADVCISEEIVTVPCYLY